MSGNRKIKCGDLKINKSGLLSHKWQQKFCVLLKCNDKQPAVLEIAESHADYEADKKKDIILDNVVSIECVQKFKEHPHAFDVHLKKDKHTFAVDDEDELKLWMEAFRHACYLFKEAPQVCGIEENDLYESADQSLIYSVELKEEEAENNIGLEGKYNLMVGLSEISLLDEKHRKEVCRWPLSGIRRYGVLEDGLFYLEAGRRCPAGPGCYKFATNTGYVITDMIKRKSMKTSDIRPSSSGLSDSSKSWTSSQNSTSKKAHSSENLTHSEVTPNEEFKFALDRKLSIEVKKKEEKKEEKRKKTSKEEQKKASKETKSSKEEQQKSTKEKKKEKKSLEKTKTKVLPDIVKPGEQKSAPPQFVQKHTYEEVDVADATSQSAPASVKYSQAYKTRDLIPNRQMSIPKDVNSKLKSRHSDPEDEYTEVENTPQLSQSSACQEDLYDDLDQMVTSNKKLPVISTKPSKRHEQIYDEPDEYIATGRRLRQEQTPEILYDQVDMDFKTQADSKAPVGVVYSQPNKVNDAWRHKGRTSEVHEEHYEAIKAAAESGDTKPVLISQDIGLDSDIYSHLAFKTKDSKSGLKHIIKAEEDDTYAHAAAFITSDEKSEMTYENYESVTARGGSCSQAEVQRSSGGSNSSGYTEFVK